MRSVIRKRPTPHKSTAGFTIIEVLVSMVILAIGVLSLGLLQLSAMQNTQGGNMRSLATILAYDIIDAMRTNIVSVNNGNYQLGLDDDTPGAINCYGSLVDCAPNQIATSDLVRWRTVLNAYLPSGTGSVVTTDIGTTTQVTITVRWTDPYSAEAGPEQVVLVSELPQ